MVSAVAEKKKISWIYKYEKDGLYPIMEVGKENLRLKYEIYNPVDCLYTFCKVDVTDDGSGDFELRDTFFLEVPGNEVNPQMGLYVSNEMGSPLVSVMVKDVHGAVVSKQNFLLGDAEIEELSKQEILDRTLMQLEAMPGLGEIKEEIENLIECVQLKEYREKQGLPPLKESHHLVFTGNPGTGKTTVARMLGDVFAALGVSSSNKVIETDRSGLVGEHVGQTAILTKQMIDQARGGILYIDEAYTLAKDGNDFGQESIDTLLKAMEDYRDDFIVVVAGYPDKMSKFIHSNPGLESRFKTFIHFKDYSGEELYEIFLSICETYEMKVEEEAQASLKDHFVKMERRKGSNFANGREVRNFFEDVIGRQAHRLSKMEKPSAEELSTITLEDLGIGNNKAIQTEAMEELNAMIGLHDVKEEVQNLLHLIRNQMDREGKGLPVERISHHMVFTGNPGTGKTTVARILAKTLSGLGVISEDKLIEADASMLIAGYVGQTATKTKDLINSAKGGVLFIDEAYALEDSRGGFGREAINTLLKEMEDCRDSLVVIVAGYEQEMEKFIKSNPGLESRFNNYIRFEDYSSAELLQIIESYCEKEQYKMDSEAKKLLQSYIAKHMEAFTGNGRAARNLYERLKKQQAGRLSDGEHEVEELVLITREDICQVILKMKNNNTF